MTKIFLGLCLLLFVYYAIRNKQKLNSRIRGIEVPTDVVETPFSQALAQLASIAGGIYISLVTIISFLELSVPGKFNFWGVEVNTLAGISLVMALLQPFLMNFYYSLKNNL